MHGQQNVKKKRTLFSHAQNTTARHANIFVTGIHQLLFTNKGQSAFPSGNNCRDQLQTPLSGSRKYPREKNTRDFFRHEH